ncbi:MAG TPA: hypothetical protein VN931_04935 [Fibrobacteria bacterium]|nr:hypothetical protein [Fibrobacteria bacterium]
MSQSELPRTFRQLLAALPADFRRTVLETLLTDKEARPAAQEALRIVAGLRKMRAQTLSQLGRTERVQIVLSALGQPALENSAMQALQVWFLRQGRPIMAQLLDSWKVSHTDGELSDDAVFPPLTSDQVVESSREAAKTHAREAVAAYLGYNHIAPPTPAWEGVFEAALREQLA